MFNLFVNMIFSMLFIMLFPVSSDPFIFSIVNITKQHIVLYCCQQV